MFKKSLKSMIMSMLFLFTVIAVTVVADSEKVSAEQPGVLLELVESSATSVTIMGTNYFGDTDDFIVYMCDVNNPDYVWTPTTGRFSATYGCLINSLNPSSSYIVQICSATGNWSNQIEVSTTPTSNPTITKVYSEAAGQLTVEWTAVPDANYYVVSYYDCYNGDYHSPQYVEAEGCSVTFKVSDANSKYSLKVYAAHRGPNGSIGFGYLTVSSSMDVCPKPAKPAKPIISSRWYKNSADNAITLNTEKIQNAEGYEYEVYDCVAKKTVKKFVGARYSYSYFEATNNAFKALKILKVRVRAYTLNSDGGKQYGAWSAWNYIHEGLSYTSKKANGSLSLTWDKVGGAGRYAVYISTKKDSGYKKATTVTANKATIKKCGSSSISKNKTYYVKIIPEIKVSGKFVQCADVWYCEIY